MFLLPIFLSKDFFFSSLAIVWNPYLYPHWSSRYVMLFPGSWKQTFPCSSDVFPQVCLGPDIFIQHIKRWSVYWGTHKDTQKLCSGKVLASVNKKEKHKGREGGKQAGKKGNPVCLEMWDEAQMENHSRTCSPRCCVCPTLAAFLEHSISCSVAGFSTLLLNNLTGKIEQLLTELLKV